MVGRLQAACISQQRANSADNWSQCMPTQLVNKQRDNNKGNKKEEKKMHHQVQATKQKQKFIQNIKWLKEH